MTKTSSARLSAQLENGSGLVLATARVPALVKCVPAARVPPRSATRPSTVGLASPSAATAMRAPPTGRISVWTASQSESSQGILSATNSIDVQHERRADDDVVVEDAELLGQRDPAEALGQAEDRDRRVEVDAGRERKAHRPAERGQHLEHRHLASRARHSSVLADSERRSYSEALA